MFANVLRTQARFSLVRAARVAVPATRSISSLVTLRAAAPIASRFAVRAFSNSTPSFDRPRNPPSNTIFVGNVPWETTQEDLARLFSDFGTIDGEIRMPVDNQGRPRGFAHITFTDEVAAVTAVNSALQEPLHIAGRDLTLDFATNKRQLNAALPPQPSNKIYFSNFDGGEAGIRSLFQDYENDIVSVFLLRDANTGASLPNGFVEFSRTDIATNVIEKYDGVEMPSGAVLQVNYARPRKPRTDNDRSEYRRPDNRSNNRRGNAYTNRGYSRRDYD